MSDQEVMVPEWIRAAQMLIAEVYARLQRESEPMEFVVLTPEEYRLLQNYRASVGELDKPGMDYLGQYHLFGREIRIGQRSGNTLPQAE
ncbi:hypothetical protein [Spirochaeta africana]|uniref:Uncharacterized protein n=1 Tax=Spirochaeta africana (strain ATCC 700263 / DSM 8902 / Z-7692) TaxID=889378 RepID=H9UJ36_SPIAZ|nr:hypothetical protein [Spirochaeta africana]AFG37529.1 hypothetical protein Spiaf_1466 [Spirochaeta africana DSM 8902]